MFDVVGVVGEPTLSKDEPTATSGPVLVDGVVGYINNRAIYISDFSRPMEQRCGPPRQAPGEEWIKFSREQISASSTG